jgi:hypothetical protein
MKTRAGCGGSAFPRLRVSCGSINDCGPCGHLPDPAGGCNIGGTRMWYCEDETLDVCGCVNTIFHEMAHACGQFDAPKTYDSATGPASRGALRRDGHSRRRAVLNCLLWAPRPGGTM